MAKSATPKSRPRRKPASEPVPTLDQIVQDTSESVTEALHANPDPAPQNPVDTALKAPVAPLAEGAAGAPVTADHVTADPMTEAPVIEAPVIEAPVIEAPVIEAPVGEASGSAESAPAEPAPSETAPPEPRRPPPTDSPRIDTAPVAAVPAAAIPAAPARGGSAGLAVLAGAVAAVLGAGGAWFVLDQRAEPVVQPTALADLGALESRLEAIERHLAAPGLALDDIAGLLDARLAALPAAPEPVDLSGLEQRLADLADRLQAIEGDLTARVSASLDETLTRAQAQAATAALARADEIAAARSDLAATEDRITRRAALAELIGAAQTGSPAPLALDTLRASLGTLPAGLEALGAGLPTQAALLADWPAAARDALAAVPPPADAPLGDRLWGLLRAQTNARSLAPRDGDDPDAVLSRAEAALRAGDLAAALAELDTLPDPVLAALADWRAQAQGRADALAALDALRLDLD